MDSLGEAALNYARQGWRIFQIQSVNPDGSCTCGKACGRTGKHPVPDTAPNGLLSATDDPELITAWWTKHPRANIGGATGALSGCVVLDIDPGKGGDETLTAWEMVHGPLPETVMSLTGGGGRHYVFKHPGVEINNRSKFLGTVPGQETGVDFRGDGGYVVLPPSLHQSGHHYLWELSSLPEEVPLADLPEDLLKEVQREVGPTPTSKGGEGEPVIEGGRNDFLFKAGCDFRRWGLNPEQIYLNLVKLNEERCQPPLGDLEVRRAAKSAGGYTPREFKADGTAKKNLGDLARLTRPDAYSRTSLTDLMNEPQPEFAFLVEGLLLIGGTSLWVAKPGVGKSTLMRTLVRAVAGGRESFLSRGAQHGSVWYFAMEERRDQVAKHFAQMGVSDMLHDVQIIFGQAPEDALEVAYHDLQEDPPALVVFDPILSIARVNDLNNYILVREVMSKVAAIANDLHCHIACIHHAGKGTRDDIDTGVGSIAFSGTTDTHLVLGKRPGDVRVIKSAKLRYGDDLPETVLLLDENREVIDGGTLEERLLERLRVQIIDVLGNEELTEPEINQRLGDTNRGGVNRALNSMVQAEVLVFRGNGRRGSPRLYSQPADLSAPVWETLEIPALWQAGTPLPPEGLGF